MSKKAMLRSALWLTGAVALALPAYAQEARQTGASAHSEDDIVVTARRREERVQDVPLAVTALSAAAIERQNITNIESLNGRVAGLVVSNSLGGGRQAPVYTIRGQSQQELAGIADPSVSLYVNDVPVPRAHGSNMAFFDLAGVEVARGPQGTLFGRNTTGGAVLLRTQLPSDVFEANISQMIGNYNAQTTEAVLNLPLSDSVSFRIAGHHFERDGFLIDDITGKDINTINENAVRLGLTWRPTDTLKTTFVAAYSNADNGGTGGYVVFAQDPLYATALPQQRARDFYHTASGFPMFAKAELWSVDNTTTWELSPHHTIKNIVGYRSMRANLSEDSDGAALFNFTTERYEEQSQWTEEIQLQGNFDRFNYILGAFYFREDISDQALSVGARAVGAANAPDPGAIEPGHLLSYAPRYSNTWLEPVNTSYALFAQGSYKLTDRLSATVGLRQNWDERETVVRNRAFQSAISTTDLSCRFTLDEDHNPATPETRPTLANCIFRDSAEFSELTYNLGLEYHASRDALLYGALRHGYRTGGFGARGNTEASLADTFEPETVDDLELGIKADWHPGGMFLRTNLAIYYDVYSGAQRFLNRPTTPPVTETVNADEAIVKGTELELLFRPVDLFELSAFWAYTDGEFTEFKDPAGNDLTPQVYPHTPKNIYSITGRLNIPVDSSIGSMSFSVTYYHQDEQDVNDVYTPEVTLAGVPIPSAIAQNRAEILPGYELVNLNFEWSSVLGSNVDLSAFVDNATDEQYLQMYHSTPTAFETRTPGAPRMYGVKVKYNFN